MAPLVTDEQLASYLQRDLDRATADLAVAGASGLVRDYCRWDIYPQADVTFTVDGSGTSVLLLPTLKLVAVEEVRVLGEVIDPDDYEWSESGLLVRAAGWPARLRAVDVDCTHGYDPVPDTVALVTCAVAARYYANPERLRAKAVGGVSRTYGDGLADLEMALLAAYRLA